MKPVLLIATLLVYFFVGNAQNIASKSSQKLDFNIDSFLSKHLQYPKEGYEQELSGIVNAFIWISGNGHIDTVATMNKEGSVFAKEVIRAIRMSDGLWPNDKKRKYILIQVVFEHEMSGTENVQVDFYDLFIYGKFDSKFYKVPYTIRGPVIIMRTKGGGIK